MNRKNPRELGRRMAGSAAMSRVLDHLVTRCRACGAWTYAATYCRTCA